MPLPSVKYIAAVIVLFKDASYNGLVLRSCNSK